MTSKLIAFRRPMLHTIPVKLLFRHLYCRYNYFIYPISLFLCNIQCIYYTYASRKLFLTTILLQLYFNTLHTHTSHYSLQYYQYFASKLSFIHTEKRKLLHGFIYHKMTAMEFGWTNYELWLQISFESRFIPHSQSYHNISSHDKVIQTITFVTLIIGHCISNSIL